MNPLVRQKALCELSVAKKYLNKTLFLFENDYDCILVVKNSRKAQRALGNAQKIMLEGHLECCISEKFKALRGNNNFKDIVQLLRN